MKYRCVILLALTALCLVECENGKKNTAGESDWYSGYNLFGLDDKLSFFQRGGH